MSITKYSKKEFLAVKKLPNFFKFLVEDWREMETQYGKGIYLVGEVVQTAETPKSKDVVQKGLLRVSPTTATSMEKLNLREWDQLVGKIVHFEWDADANTILVIDVTKWTGESITDRSETEVKKKPKKTES